MNLIQPVALWALLAVPLILLFYILRPRHRRLIVPSVRLWQHLPSDLEGRPRWRLPISSLLLALQLIVAAATAFALARPAFPGPVRQHLILLLDTSPTMLATDVQPNRLGLAVEDARAAVARLSPDDQVTLISIEPLPRVLGAGKGPRAIDDALAHVGVAPNRGDVNSAMLLAAQTAQLSRDTHNRIVILSDGTFGGLPLKSLGSIPADVSFQQVGGSDENQGITALSVRPMIGSLNRFVGFIQVTNFSHQEARVSFQARADGLPIDRETLNLPARGHVEISLPLPVGSHHFQVAIDPHDRLAADDQAEVLVPDARPIPVTLVSADPSYWERALKTLPIVQLAVVAPGAYKPDNAALTIFDNFVPAALPAGSVVLVAPPRGNPIVPVTGEIQNVDVVHADQTSSLFDSVDLAGLYIPQTDAFGSVPWARSVADSSRGPVILDGTQNGRRVIVLGFSPDSTDWPQRISFPVFIANLIDTVVSTPVPTDVQAGAVLDLPAASGASQVVVRLPDGKADVFAGAGRPIRFTDTAEPGRYAVSYTSGAATIARYEFVVSRLGVTTSNIMPQVDPTQIAQAGSPAGQPSQHEVWTYVVGGALALLAIEWLVYFRRPAG